MILADDELIVSVSIPVTAGPQEFLKIGIRNAMVISVASLALVVETRLRVGDRQGRPRGAALRERR